MKPTFQQALQRTIFWAKITTVILACFIVLLTALLAYYLAHFDLTTLDLPQSLAVLGLVVSIFSLYAIVQYTRCTEQFSTTKTKEKLAQATVYEGYFWYSLVALIIVAFWVFLAMIIEF